MDTFLLLILMAAASLLGSGVVLGGGRLLGAPTLSGPLALLVLGLPILAAWLAELSTGLWRHTPGTLGLGSLTATVPMFVSGFSITFAALVMRIWVEPFDQSVPRDSVTLTAWLMMAVMATVLTLALWRYWPEPRARLF